MYSSYSSQQTELPRRSRVGSSKRSEEEKEEEILLLEVEAGWLAGKQSVHS